MLDLLMEQTPKSRLSVLFSEMIYEVLEDDPCVASVCELARRLTFKVESPLALFIEVSHSRNKQKGIHYLDHQAQKYARKPAFVLAGMNEDCLPA